ncbi:MAG TPA: SCP2 sterol-binding domain-containing protein [Acidimicrobiales bacterium]|jgi:putative sterol carrier protein|nr:SCP2 sterol-binding domain-containing protein [Acidimicrobiales bacterium]
MSHPFLSEEWLAAVEELQVDAPEPLPAMKDLTVNVVVQGGPDGDHEIHLNGGQFERGLADEAPTKLIVPYDTAKALFVEGNPQAAMQAFMSGQIKVEGDMSKLMAMQGGMATPSPEQKAFQEKLQALTA